MSIPGAAVLLTFLALLAGIGIILTLRDQSLVASLGNRPSITDDMGTSGKGDASDAAPSATSSLR